MRSVSPSPTFAPLTGSSRFFLGRTTDAFWVTRSAERDQAVTTGARLVLSPPGEILDAAWEIDLAAQGERVDGSLAVAPHLGGGFVHWAGSRFFRSDTLTGPLRPITLPFADEVRAQGARNGLQGVVLFTERGPFELVASSMRARGLKDAGIFDFAALDASHAARLDVFGRAATTLDGGGAWRDVSPIAGIAVRALHVAPDALALDTWQGRFSVNKDGALGLMAISLRPRRMGSDFQLVFPSPQDDSAWMWREVTPLSAAVSGGATFPDAAALAVISGAVAIVDLKTGELRKKDTGTGGSFGGAAQADWLPSGLQCRPFQAEDGVLLLCGWDAYQGYGGYVLRTGAGEPPHVERAFSDDGYFIGDDNGALAYAGSCRLESRLVDSHDPPDERPFVSPVACVRRGPGDWVERRVQVEAGTQLYGWAVRKDGTAVAILFDPRLDGLPEQAGKPSRVLDRGSVRVVRVFREIEGWLPPPSLASEREQAMMRPTMNSGPIIDKRWRVNADGSVDGWLLPEDWQDLGAAPSRGVTLRPDGHPDVHELPPNLVMNVVTGDFGVAMTASGALYETLDHGQSWKQAGVWPAPLTQSAGDCSRLGCAIGALVRLGWGPARVAPRIAPAGEVKPPSAASGAPVRLACIPAGIAVPLPLPPGESTPIERLQTGYGETLEAVRDSLFDQAAPAKPPASRASPAGPGGGTKPPLRTQSLLFRPPFDLEAPIRRLDATQATFDTRQRYQVTPLLDNDGRVALLATAQSGELLIRGDRIIVLPAFESRRYSYRAGESGAAGLLLAGDRPLVIGDIRRRLSLEEHGVSPGRTPVFIGNQDDRQSKRPVTLARRDGGTPGILVWDGPAPETLGVAEIHRTDAGLSAVTRLSPWSSAVAATDPGCRADPGAWQALFVIDPAQWFAFDPAALPGVKLGAEGLMLARWSAQRVCVEALDLVALDLRPSGSPMAASRLVVRFAGSGAGQRGKPNAVLVSEGLKQKLHCTLELPADRP